MRKIIYVFTFLFGMNSFAQGVLWQEDFEASTIPSDWTTWGGEGTSDWTFGTGVFPWNDATDWNFDNNAAIFSDYTADEDSHNVRILARTEQGVDASDFTNLKLEFYGSLRTSGTYGNGELIVMVFDQSTNSWRHMATYTSDMITADVVLNLETYMNTYPGIDRSDLRVGFKYDDLDHGITYGAGIAWVRITGNPINDTCSTATVVSIQEEQSTWLQHQKIIGASNNNGGVDTCNNGTYDGVWYTFTPTHSWEMSIDVFPLYNSFVEVYSGSCNNLSCVTVTEEGGGNSASYIFDAIAGTQYWVNLGVTGYSQNDYNSEPYSNSFGVFFGYKKPDNDDRYTAIIIDNFPYSNTQSIDATTNNDDTSTNGFVTVCAPGMNDGVWYSFYAPSDGDINIDAIASQVDLEIALYELIDPNETIDFANYSCAAGADSHGMGTGEHLTAPVEVGKRYLINLGDYSSTTNNTEEGDLTIDVYYSEPANNACSQAQELSINQTVQGTTAGADSSIVMCGNTMDDYGVWYHFTSTYGGMVSIEISNSSNGSYDENLAVLTGESNCSNMTCDFYFQENNPYAEFETQLGEDFYIYVSTNKEQLASFDLALNGIPPQNDEATGAIEIPVNGIGVTCTNPTMVYNANGVTDSSPINGTPSCASYAGGDSWYKFVAPTSGGIKINRPNNGDWGALGYAIYDSETSTTPLTCGNIATGSTESNDITGLTSGNYYWLRLWEWSNNDYGSVGICLEEVDTVGFDDLAAIGFTYYPNPVTHTLHLQAQEKIEHIQIYTLLGQKVLTSVPMLKELNLNVSKLQQGTYFIKAQVGTHTGTFKLIKE